MKVKGLIIRTAALIAIHFICFIFISAALLPRLPGESNAAEAGAAVRAILLVSTLNTLVLSYIILRSRYAGWKLVLSIFVMLYGAMTVMPQIETAFFVHLPSGMLPRLFLSGAVFGIVFSLLAIVVLGKKRAAAAANIETKPPKLKMSAYEWLLKLAVIATVYLVLYFTFGYFIAWKSEAVRAYYGGNDPGSFVAQLHNVLRATPWLFPLQVFRAILWTAIAVVVIRTMKGHWWEVALAVALLFSVMSAQLLIPNPLMPAEVRMVHLLETVSSNLIFGWLIVFVLLRWKPRIDTVKYSDKVLPS